MMVNIPLFIVSYIPGGPGFQPSTVGKVFNLFEPGETVD